MRSVHVAPQNLRLSDTNINAFIFIRPSHLTFPTCTEHTWLTITDFAACPFLSEPRLSQFTGSYVMAYLSSHFAYIFCFVLFFFFSICRWLCSYQCVKLFNGVWGLVLLVKKCDYCLLSHSHLVVYFGCVCSCNYERKNISFRNLLGFFFFFHLWLCNRVYFKVCFFHQSCLEFRYDICECACSYSFIVDIKNEFQNCRCEFFIFFNFSNLLHINRMILW